jgi:SRSO17 transposase
MTDTLETFLQPYGPLFGRREAQRHAETYLRGLLECESIRRSAATLTPDGHEPRSLQRFLSQSGWSIEPLVDAIQRAIAHHLSAPDGTFIVGEVGFRKQGPHSAGVSVQPCGADGKVMNCQVGVFLAYGSSRGSALIDARLYLPNDWAEDLPRRRAAKIPDSVVYRSREELGLDMLRHILRRAELAGEWVAGSGRYAESSHLRQGLDQEGVHYLLEVPRSATVFAAPGSAGDESSANVSGIQGLLDRGWQSVAPMNGTVPTGHLFAVRRVRDSHKGSPGSFRCLVVRRNADGRDPHYYLSNAGDAPLDVIAGVAMRLETVQAYLKRADRIALRGYEVRSWAGWHHHVALALLADLYRMTRRTPAFDEPHASRRSPKVS